MSVAPPQVWLVRLPVGSQAKAWSALLAATLVDDHLHSANPQENEPDPLFLPVPRRSAAAAPGRPGRRKGVELSAPVNELLRKDLELIEAAR
jgi:hypothetical protein